jgi:hypothetical protein
LPDVVQLQERVLAELAEGNRESFQRLLTDRNIEEALSRLRRIASLLSGDDTVDGLTSASASALDREVCHAIVKSLSIEDARLSPVYHLAAWVSRAHYHLPVELFTLNYDLLLETGLEKLGVPYFDGFVGNLKARFHPELVEASPESKDEWIPSFFVRLWKLHGSVNWAKLDDGQITRIGQAAPEGRAAAIYPSDTKYEESRRVPFVVLHDRLRRALNYPETLVIVTGYSFGDSHVNEVLFDAAIRRERSEFVVFIHGEIPTVVAEKAALTPNLQVASGKDAILGGERLEWRPPEEPDEKLWKEDKFALRDFSDLATYLGRSSVREAEGDLRLRELLREVGADPGTEGNGTCRA